jgi:hypothetical protein
MWNAVSEKNAAEEMREIDENGQGNLLCYCSKVLNFGG